MPFLHIVNLSLATGVAPHISKNACVVPLLKCQSLDSDVMRNYRPVSNLSYVSKVTEKCVHRQVLVHLESIVYLTVVNLRMKLIIVLRLP